MSICMAKGVAPIKTVSNKAAATSPSHKYEAVILFQLQVRLQSRESKDEDARKYGKMVTKNKQGLFQNVDFIIDRNEPQAYFNSQTWDL